ncbi:MAG: ArsC/Spx/MgsR family protein [Planktomarina sp.]
MKLYGLKTCDSCRKALKAFAAEGLDVEYKDVRKDGVPLNVLEQAYAEFGGKLVNKSSATWRGFSDEEKAGDHWELLKAHPTLMKRPLIEKDGALTLGWSAQV